MKRCFYCNESITDEQHYKIIPLDNPYINLFFHDGDCYFKGCEEGYIENNIERIINLIKENKNRKGKM